MKRTTSPIFCLGVAVVLALGLACGEQASLGPDTAIIEHPSAEQSPRIVNGSAYDIATLDLAGLERLYVPAAARVERRAELTGTHATLRLTKTLGFAGEPPAPMTPRHARRYMGLATLREPDTPATLKLGSYGEWDSQDKGRAWLVVQLLVPAHLELDVIHDEALGGADSIAAGKLVLKGQPGHWYASNQPASNWQALATKPDRASADAERR